jgi:hypothetical protein
MKFDLIVTRHPALLQYLKEIGLADEDTKILSHATPMDMFGEDVCGVLLRNLSCLCDSFTEIPLNLPTGLCGVELSIDQIRQYAGKPVDRRYVNQLPVVICG